MINRDRFRSGGCPDDEPRDLPAPVGPPTRPRPKCDPPAVPTPDTFSPPDPAVRGPARRARPTDLTVESEAVDLTCEEDWPGNPEVGTGASGDPVSLPAGYRTGSLVFRLIEGLSEADLVRLETVMSDPAAFTEALEEGEAASFLGLSAPSVAAIVAAWNAVRDRLTAEATTVAIAMMDCAWLSEEVTLSCDDVHPGSPGAAEGVDNPVTIAAGSYSSRSSQEAANDRAERAATEQLRCVWSNDTVTRTCGDIGLPALNPGQPNPLTGGNLGTETAGSPGPDHPTRPGVSRINSATVAAGTLTSTVSKAAANAAAAARADASLECFFLNVADELECEDEDSTVSPGTLPSTPGNPVTIPAAEVASDVSWEAAAEEAESRAAALLTCDIRSAPITLDCTELGADLEVYSTLVGDDVTVTIDETASPVFSVSLEEGYLTFAAGGGATQESVDAAALQTAQALLSCIFCTPTVSGRCAIGTPEEFGEDDAYSIDATLGVTTPMCSTTPEAAVGLMDAIGLAPDTEKTGGSICRFGNEDIVVSCAENEEADVNLSDYLSLEDPYDAVGFTGLATFEVKAGTYVAADLAAANSQAILVAAAALQCAYTESVTVECPVGDYGTPSYKGDDRPTYLWHREKGDEPPIWLISESGPNGEVLRQDITHTPPTATGSSTSFVSRAEAEEAARVIAESRLRCPYTNYDRSSTASAVCSAGRITLGATETIYVPAGSYVSDFGSTEEANIMAEIIASASVNCVEPRGGQIDLVYRAVHGGWAQAMGAACDLDCDIPEGTMVPFEQLDIDESEEASYWLKVECEESTESGAMAFVVKMALDAKPIEEAGVIWTFLGEVREVNGELVVYQAAVGLIPFSGCSSPEELPEGTNIGDMLYWDGTEWNILARPGSTTDAPYFLSHDGTDSAPTWVGSTTCEEEEP